MAGPLIYKKGLFGGEFNPLSLSPVLWLDASDASTLYDETTGGALVSADGSIARWEDKSGNGYHFTQSTPANRPQRKTSIQNGKDVIRFDGGNDFLSRGATPIFKNITGGTILSVLKFNADNTSAFTYFQIDNNAGAGSARANQFKLITTKLIGSGGRRLDANSFAFVNTSSGRTSTAAYLHESIFDYANSSLSQYINTQLDGKSTTFQTTGSTSDTDSGAQRVGAGSIGNTAWLNGDFCELIVINALLTEDQTALIRNYLNAKWAIY